MASVDVVIPNYNYARYLRPCVESVLNQDIDDLRILIIDNASSDDSVEVARDLAGRNSRIEVRAREKNLGPHASFNEGVDWAEADYFVLVWADDLLAPGCLLRAVSFLERHPETVFTIGNEIPFFPDDPLPASRAGENPRWQIFDSTEFITDRCRKFVAGPAVARTAVQKQAGHYRPELYFTDDLEMLLRLATFGGCAQTHLPQSFRRMHGSNFCDIHKLDRARELKEIEAAFTIFFEREGRPFQQLHQSAQRNLVESAYWWGLRDLTKGRWRTGSKLLRFAFARAPGTAVLPPVGFLLENSRAFHRVSQLFRRGPETDRGVPKSS